MEIINVNVANHVIQEDSYGKLAELTGLSPSVFSHYRNGRSIEKNMFIRDLIKLNKTATASSYTPTTSDVIYEISTGIIDTFVKNVKNEKNTVYYNEKVSLIEYSKDVVSKGLNLYSKLDKEGRLEVGSLKLPEYEAILSFNKEVEKFKDIDNSVILSNFERIVYSVGQSLMSIALKNNKSYNYFSNFISRHKNNKIMLYNLSQKTYESLAEIFYNGDVNHLKNELLKGC